jgi:hypothetical protein
LQLVSPWFHIDLQKNKQVFMYRGSFFFVYRYTLTVETHFNRKHLSRAPILKAVSFHLRACLFTLYFSEAEHTSGRSWPSIDHGHILAIFSPQTPHVGQKFLPHVACVAKNLATRGICGEKNATRGVSGEKNATRGKICHDH